tara:strand:- start:350 stop:865 length:516 start_codon:yes stop_codon:yes gene_type:complete
MDEMENLIAQSKKEKSLYKTIKPIVEKDDFELVRIKIFNDSELTLQIMVDHNCRPLTIDDCKKISRNLSDELDQENFLEKEYHLEVSSPGLNRPLTRLKDFDDWKGHKVFIRRKVNDLDVSWLEGTLVGLINSKIHVLQNDQILHIKVCNIEEANLVAQIMDGKKHDRKQS